jgi:hypothetical protein
MGPCKTLVTAGEGVEKHTSPCSTFSALTHWEEEFYKCRDVFCNKLPLYYLIWIGLAFKPTQTIKMPLGILEDHKLEHVPGTSPLNELGSLDVDIGGIDSRILKHDPTGKIVLIPQPSDSPNDPYNWPRWKKEMFTVAIAYGCGCVGGEPVFL